jgi:hypothetical protein
MPIETITAATPTHICRIRTPSFLPAAAVEAAPVCACSMARVALKAADDMSPVVFWEKANGIQKSRRIAGLRIRAVLGKGSGVQRFRSSRTHNADFDIRYSAFDIQYSVQDFQGVNPSHSAIV